MKDNENYPLYDILPQINSLKELVTLKSESIPNKIAFKYIRKRKEIIEKSYSTFAEDVQHLGTYLYHQNFKGAHIGIVSENSYEWIVAFMAIANSGNVAVPIDKELSEKQIHTLLKQTDCNAVFVSHNYIDLVQNMRDIQILNMQDFDVFLKLGKNLVQNGSKEFEKYEIIPDKLAAIFFTSGTMGKYKGVMLSHKNIISNINSACKLFRLDGNTVSVLPFHHTFGLITAIFMVMNYGKSSFINQSIKYFQRDILLEKPQSVFLVPMFIENFYNRLKDNEEIIDFFGGNLEYIICGGAYLEQKYIDFFRNYGITILNGYGITECSPVVSVNRNHYQKTNSVGYILDNFDVKISNDNEIILKGTSITLGYYRDDVANKETFHDGWYYTGDIGYIKDNFLYITGRKKNLIILSNGENISAEHLESEIKNYMPYVKEVLVYAQNNMITAEVFTDNIFKTETQIKRDIADLNITLPQNQNICSVIVRKKEFAKTTTRKIIRSTNYGGENSDD